MSRLHCSRTTTLHCDNPVNTKPTVSAPHLLLGNQVCFPLYSAANALVRAYRPFLDPIGLTYLQYMVLMVLWEETSLKVKDLGARLGLDSGTLTPLLKRLDSKGLIKRQRSREDERVRIISITHQGQKLRDRALKIPKALANSTGLPGAKMRELKDLCEQLLTALEDESIS